MIRLVATLVDTVDAMVRRLVGQRLCALCQRWARHPYTFDGCDFCDRIHASIYAKKKEEALKEALRKSGNTTRTR
jgi:hypothetical protein